MLLTEFAMKISCNQGTTSELQEGDDGGAELQAGDDDGAAIIDEEGAASDGVHEDFSCWNRRGFVPPWIFFF